MSVVRRKARNHPQQRTNPDVDDRSTTAEVFEPLDRRFGHFTVDVAAAAHNTKVAHYWTVEQDGLAQDWGGHRVWCNPPYSSIEPWVRKAWAERHRAELVVMLLPANRTEQRWWQDLVEPYRDRPRSPLSVEFLGGRLRFLTRGQTVIGPDERPPFGCCLLIWRSHEPEPDLTLFGDQP
ncbi:MAG: DNA N-6-adenine-methyltransferase [Acidimicrobiia bacterium]|nr:DNA N-6-adenine-methyltransferase [Acidimicrobiia bacterium]